MKALVTSLALLVSLFLLPAAPAAQETEGTAEEAAAQNPRVTFQTTKGTFTLELFPDKAPKTVENFLQYAESGFYDGTVFHRVIPGFMAQGGGLTADLDKKDTRGPIPNEADNGLSNARGTIAMARTGDPHSATAQFFINVADNPSLDHTGKTMRGWGYTVFGRVVDGMDVVDAIVQVPTTSRGGMQNVPVEPVVIQSVGVER